MSLINDWFTPGTGSRVDFLEQVVLGEIKRLTKYAVRYEDEFQQAIMGSTQKTVELERKLKQKELTAAQARDSELDGLFERIYEDTWKLGIACLLRSSAFGA